MAYFANSSTGAGILGEALTAALNVNAMLWRTSPAATELELLTLDWLRQMLGLPAEFFGTIADTASSNTLYALTAARELHPELRIREQGMAAREDLPRVFIYCSEEAHSSVDKAVMTLGFGQIALRKIRTDDRLRMDANALAETVESDRKSGAVPLAVVATVGTTSTTAIDPVPVIAGICEREKMWLHVDASYGGTAAILPEMRYVLDGCDRADSLVVNPHKWLFTPMDCSVLYTRRPDLLKRAFQHIPDYLVVSDGQDAVNLMDYGVALGRRFRALKLWFVIRHFGVEGLRSLIREHIRIARQLSEWIDADRELERMADVDFSTVIFRHCPPGLADEKLDEHNVRILEAVNGSREVYLSHTRVRGRIAAAPVAAQNPAQIGATCDPTANTKGDIAKAQFSMSRAIAAADKGNPTRDVQEVLRLVENGTDNPNARNDSRPPRALRLFGARLRRPEPEGLGCRERVLEADSRRGGNRYHLCGRSYEDDVRACLGCFG